MSRIIKGALIGIVAGVIDVVPMIIQKLDWYACSSAFVHWIILGMIIPNLNWKLKSWLKGLVAAELLALPIIIIVLKEDPVAAFPIAIFSALLGILVGVSGEKFIRETK